MTRAAESLHVLFVCTGNICRSPLAEQVFKQLAKDHGIQITTDSAGVFAEVGQDMHPQSQQAMNEANLSPESHAAKQLDTKLTRQADLILTSTRDHSESTAQLDPSAIRKTFTLKQFARVAEFLTENPNYQQSSGLQDKLSAAINFRGYAANSNDDDIEDPWGREYAAYQTVTQQTQQLAKQIIDWMVKS